MTAKTPDDASPPKQPEEKKIIEVVSHDSAVWEQRRDRGKDIEVNRMAVQLEELRQEAQKKKDSERLKQRGLKRITIKEMKEKEAKRRRIIIAVVAAVLLMAIVAFLLINPGKVDDTRIRVLDVAFMIPAPEGTTPTNKSYIHNEPKMIDYQHQLTFDNRNWFDKSVATVGTLHYFKVLIDNKSTHEDVVGSGDFKFYNFKKSIDKGEHNQITDEGDNFVVWMDNEPAITSSCFAVLQIANRRIVLEAVTDNKNDSRELLSQLNKWYKNVLETNKDVKPPEPPPESKSN